MTVINVDKITPGSGTTTTLGDSGDTFTIPAGVTFTNAGSTNMGDQVSYCTTTKSASFTAVANKGYFINTADASPFLNYAVTVASGTLYSVGGTGNAYFLDGSRNMALTLLKGRTYRFTQTDNTNDSHPLIISTSNSTTLSTFIAGIVSSGVSYYLDGASNQSSYINTTSFNAATTRYIEFQPQTTGTFYFGCYVHGVQMGGAITSQDLTVTLPSSPTVGTEMIIIDTTGKASTNNIIIGRNGSKIKGACLCATLNTDRVGVRLIYSDASQGWITITSANESAPVLNQTAYVTATGGTITTSGDYKIHTFLSDANFIVSCGGTPSGNNQISYLVVAGGGGAGHDGGGGGGAGGFREGKCSNDPYTDSPLDSGVSLTASAGTYPITVGAGGTKGTPAPQVSGQGGSSVFSTITSAGGGRGGQGSQGSPEGTGGAGGSGGGARSNKGAPGGAGNTPPVSPPQGNPGGASNPATPPFSNWSGAGGGGATTAGADFTASTPSGVGGTGATTSITASPVVYAGGGGGGANNPGNSPNGAPGGPGGGGNGGSSPGGAGTNGTTNTGGGGGGGSCAQPNGGGTGGSGIVVLRYKYQN